MGGEPQCQGLHPLAFQSRTTEPTLVLAFPPSHFLLELCLSPVFLSTSGHDQQQQNSGIHITTVSGFRDFCTCGKWVALTIEERISLINFPCMSWCSFWCCTPAKMAPAAWTSGTISLVGSSPNRRDSALTNGMSGCHESTSQHCAPLAYSLQNILMAHWAGSTCGAEMHSCYQRHQLNKWIIE